MDSVTINNRSKTHDKKQVFIKLVLLAISTVNLIILLVFTSVASELYERTSIKDVRLNLLMIMIINSTFFGNILMLLNKVYTRKFRDIRYCLEYLIVIFVLNIVPMITKNEMQTGTCSYNQNAQMCDFKEIRGELNVVYDFIWFNCNFVYVMIILEIYFAYSYNNCQLKFPQQNISPAPPLRGRPSAPTNLSETVPTRHVATTRQTGQITTTQRPLQNTVQPVGQNAICQPDQNATERHIIHYIVQQPGKNVTLQPVTSAYNPQHVVQIPLQLDQSMITTPMRDSEGSITRESVKITSNPPPYSKSDDE